MAKAQGGHTRKIERSTVQSSDCKLDSHNHSIAAKWAHVGFDLGVLRPSALFIFAFSYKASRDFLMATTT